MTFSNDQRHCLDPAQASLSLAVGGARHCCQTRVPVRTPEAGGSLYAAATLEPKFRLASLVCTGYLAERLSAACSLGSSRSPLILWPPRQTRPLAIAGSECERAACAFPCGMRWCRRPGMSRIRARQAPSRRLGPTGCPRSPATPPAVEQPRCQCSRPCLMLIVVTVLSTLRTSARSGRQETRARLLA
jgi:hypothetical protein